MACLLQEKKRQMLAEEHKECTINVANGKEVCSVMMIIVRYHLKGKKRHWVSQQKGCSPTAIRTPAG